MQLKYIVTGCPRSGSVFSANLLSNCGISCGHESIFTPDGLDRAYNILNEIEKPTLSHCSTHSLITWKPLKQWLFTDKLEADSSYMAAPYIKFFPQVKIIHIVRHPIKVISSLVKDFNYFDNLEIDKSYQQFICNHLPELNKIKHRLEKAMYFYTNWNLMIQSNFFIKIEDCPNKEFFEFIGHKTNKVPPNNTNTRKQRQFDFDIREFPNGSIKNKMIELSAKYGYEI